jgi:hypothetical protein
MRWARAGSAGGGIVALEAGEELGAAAVDDVGGDGDRDAGDCDMGDADGYCSAEEPMCGVTLGAGAWCATACGCGRGSKSSSWACTISILYHYQRKNIICGGNNVKNLAFPCGNSGRVRMYPPIISGGNNVKNNGMLVFPDYVLHSWPNYDNLAILPSLKLIYHTRWLQPICMVLLIIRLHVIKN